MTRNTVMARRMWCICCHNEHKTLHNIGDAKICKDCRKTLLTAKVINLFGGKGKLAIIGQDIVYIPPEKEEVDNDTSGVSIGQD